MRKAYKWRIYPTRNQTTLLNQELAAASRLYNAALEQRRAAWKRRHLSLSYLDQASELKGLRASDIRTPANCSACQDVLRRLDKAFQAFFRRLKNGDKPGIPALQVQGPLRLEHLPQLQRRLPHPAKLQTLLARNRRGSRQMAPPDQRQDQDRDRVPPSRKLERLLQRRIRT